MSHQLCACRLQLSKDTVAAAECIAQLHHQREAAARELQGMQGLMQSMRDELEGLHISLHRWKPDPLCKAGRICRQSVCMQGLNIALLHTQALSSPGTCQEAAVRVQPISSLAPGQPSRLACGRAGAAQPA